MAMSEPRWKHDKCSAIRDINSFVVQNLPFFRSLKLQVIISHRVRQGERSSENERVRRRLYGSRPDAQSGDRFYVRDLTGFSSDEEAAPLV